MNQYVTIKVFSNELEAMMAKSLLESADISTKIQADNAGGTMPHLSFSNGIKLMVNQSNFEKAQDILSS